MNNLYRYLFENRRTVIKGLVGYAFLIAIAVLASFIPAVPFLYAFAFLTVVWIALCCLFWFMHNLDDY